MKFCPIATTVHCRLGESYSILEAVVSSFNLLAGKVEECNQVNVGLVFVAGFPMLHALLITGQSVAQAAFEIC